MKEITNNFSRKMNKRDLKRKMKGYSLYVMRPLHNSTKDCINFGNAKPCCECVKFLKNYCMSKIYYSNDSGGFTKIKARDLTNDHCSSCQIKYRSHKHHCSPTFRF